jgi:four helix bundle protein
VTSGKTATGDPRRHHDLIAWQRAVDLVKAVYQITESLPDSERFGLVSQMRRAAVSIPSNIAEGAARHSSKEFAQGLYIARGSLAEIETQLVLCRELGFVKDGSALNQSIAELFGILSGLIRSLQARGR